MKKLISIIASVAVVFSCYGQAAMSKTTTTADAEQYLKKAKWQRTTAILMVSAGTILIVAGVQTAINSDSEQEDNLGGILTISGCLINLGSIPFTVVSHINKKKARQATLSFSTTPTATLLASGNLQKKFQPGLTLKIPIGK